jgi:hypothetical protein
MSADLVPFDPDRDFDAIADFARVEVAKVASRVIKYEAYKRAGKGDQVQGYIAGMMVGALGAIVAVTEPGHDDEARALLRKHFDYWFDRGLELNGRAPLGEVQ